MKWLDPHYVLQRAPIGEALRLDLSRLLLERQRNKALDSARFKAGDRRAVEERFRHEFLLQEEEEREHATYVLLRDARRLGLVTPSRSDEKDGDDWVTSIMNERQHFLSVASAHKLRLAIREEKKQRSEARMRWVSFIAAVTGLVGSLTGFVAVFTKGG